MKGRLQHAAYCGTDRYSGVTMVITHPMSKRIFPPALILNFSFHFVAAGFLWTTYADFKPYRGFHGIVSVLLMFSLIVAMSGMFTERRLLIYIGGILRVVFYLGIISGIPSARALSLLLIIPIVFDAGVYLPFPENAILGAVCVAAIILFDTMRAVNGKYDVGFWFGNFVLTGIIPGFLVFLVSAYSKFREQNIILSRQLKNAEDAVIDVTKAHSEYLQLAMEAEERSALDERKRITRELHDSLGYNLTNVMMMLEAAKYIGENVPSELLEHLQTARNQVQLCLKETREFLYLLRGKESRKPLGMSAISRMVRVFELATRVNVAVDFANAPNSCGPDMDLTLYHFVQEGLTNAFRHGRATQVWVKFWKDNKALQVSVTDDGVGAVNIKEGIGMRGMRERLGPLGGIFETQSDGNGFVIMATFPYKE
jgi:signal transduction histidine kinase